jgi:hypothetical protein
MDDDRRRPPQRVAPIDRNGGTGRKYTEPMVALKGGKAFGGVTGLAGSIAWLAALARIVVSRAAPA